jgi:hypothetical protein
MTGRIVYRTVLIILLVCLFGFPVAAQERTFNPAEVEITVTEIEGSGAPDMLLTYPQDGVCRTWDCDFSMLAPIQWWSTPIHIYPLNVGEFVACGYPVNSLPPDGILTYPDGRQEQVRLFRNNGPQYFNNRGDNFVCYSYEHRPRIGAPLGKHTISIEYEGDVLAHDFRVEYPYCRYATQFSANQVAFSGFDPDEELDLTIYSYQRPELPSEKDPYRLYDFIASRTVNVDENGTLLLTLNTNSFNAVHVITDGLLRSTYPLYTMIGTEKLCNGDLSAYFDGRNANLIIADDTVPMYAEMSDTSRVVAELPQGTAVSRIIAQDILGDVPWYQIRTANGIQGWVRGMVFASAELQAQMPVFTEETCPGFSESRLSVNGWALLSPFAPAAPILSFYPNGQEITQVALDVPVQILQGPECAGDTAWWQVRYIDPFADNEVFVGWVAEGQGAEYWFEPLE